MLCTGTGAVGAEGSKRGPTCDYRALMVLPGFDQLIQSSSLLWSGKVRSEFVHVCGYLLRVLNLVGFHCRLQHLWECQYCCRGCWSAAVVCWANPHLRFLPYVSCHLFSQDHPIQPPGLGLGFIQDSVSLKDFILYW